jgi:hypothetical protein
VGLVRLCVLDNKKFKNGAKVKDYPSLPCLSLSLYLSPPGLQDGLFSNHTILIWVNFGGP